MAENEVIVLDSILQRQKTNTSPSLSDEEYFELFAFEQVLKNYELSFDELSYGRVGGGDDGGIDGFFCFVDSELLREDTEFEDGKKSPLLEVFLFQATTSASFSETSIDHVVSTVADLFDLSKDMKVLTKFYNAELIDRAERFRKTYLDLAASHPLLRLSYLYLSKGDTRKIHPKVQNKKGTLIETIRKYFSQADIKADFLGARELLDLSRVERSYTLQLNFLENYLSRGADNYVVLSSLEDYFRFITDDEGNLRRYVFESNVRDYQGNVEVNKDIMGTLRSEDKLDFWWLNNGITILASRASIVSKTITLDDVQIVNGLQTTQAIYDYVKESPQVEERDRNRSILIRIIVIDNAEARDRIIKATNFQTPIPAASLRATDRFQRDIEDYFLHHGLFYDRRKNYYKNIGKPADKIISIPYLAQSVMAILLREPDNARARPTSLIKRQSDYERVFSESTTLDVYFKCAKIMKRLDSFLRGDFPVYSEQEKNNLKFHIAMVAVIFLLGNSYAAKAIESLKDSDIDETIFNEALATTVHLAQQFSSNLDWTVERTSKSRDFVRYTLENIPPRETLFKQ
jgi:hypothetical protein